MSVVERFSVLIVDDESTVRDLLVTLFRAEGFEVGAVESAAVALASVLDQPFDAVLTDIRMPRDNGLDLLLRIKKYRPTLPVVLMTGDPQMASLPETRELATAVFVKPFPPHTLLDLFREFKRLKKERVRGSGAYSGEVALAKKIAG
jgi:DNA-binding NtrC family response regulator